MILVMWLYHDISKVILGILVRCYISEAAIFANWS